METTTKIDLRQRWEALLEDNPKLRIRNAAKELGVSEAELLATKVGESVTRLEADWAEFLKELPRLGYVMALSRNDSVVHERKGEYKNLSFEHGGRIAIFLGEDIDLRIFITNWKLGFAVEEMSRGKLRKSFQFFDASGVAMHKVYLTERSNEVFFEEIKDKYLSDDQSQAQKVEPKKPSHPEVPDEQVDVESFRTEWLELKDTHDFYPLLMKYRVSRTQALRLAPQKGNGEADWTRKVENDTLRKVFSLVADREIPIMVFVGNPGIVQIHTGTISNLKDFENWYNVLDPTFNLHLNEDTLAESWIVRKPSVDGIVTSLELFDKDGTLIATIFGKRKPGIPELESWREVISSVEN